METTSIPDRPEASVPFSEKFLTVRNSCYTKNKLHTGEILARKCWNISSGCCFCSAILESINHLFFRCSFGRSLWTTIKLQLTLRGRPTCFLDLWTKWRKQNKNKLTKKVAHQLFAAVCWELWRERNGCLFLNKRNSINSVLHKLLQSFCDWRHLGSSKSQAQHLQIWSGLRSLVMHPT